jgi:hypothetical protein
MHMDRELWVDKEEYPFRDRQTEAVPKNKDTFLRGEHVPMEILSTT